MSHLLKNGYTVHEEVPLGKMPLRLDILLIRKEAGQVSESSRHDLLELLSLFNRYTLIEFKGPTDSLQSGDVASIFGYVFLWHGQQADRIPTDEISVLIVAPSGSKPAHSEFCCFGWQVSEQEPGLHRVVGAPFATWLVETDVMAERGQPVLSLFSHVFLSDHRRIILGLRNAGHTTLLAYVLQQIQMFRMQGEGFEMQHAETQYLDELSDELMAAVLEGIPVEKRLEGIVLDEVLQNIPAEKRLEGLSPEVLLQNVPPARRLEGLSPEVVLQSIPPAQRLEGLSPEVLLQNIPPERRLEGLSPEERMLGLTTEQAARLLELLRKKLDK